MNLTAIAIHIIDRLPIVGLGGIIFLAVTTAIVLWMHKNPRIPFQITWGTNGHSKITKTELLQHCETYHNEEKTAIDLIFNRQTDVLKKQDSTIEKIDALKDTFGKKIGEHDIKIAVIEERSKQWKSDT